MFEIAFIIILSVYFLISVIIIAGASKKFNKVDDDSLKSVSIIVCARNEEENIAECLQSLDELEYPEDKLEIIIANDGSTDSTGNIISDFVSGKNRFKKIAVEPSNGKLFGKTNALAQAIKQAKGQIIITTDADCKVNPKWAKTIASYYYGDTGAVGGFTIPEAKNWFDGMQAVDLAYLLTAASGSANNNTPISCIGNNMSFLKSAYLEMGGYENLPFSVTEDFALLNAIAELKKYRIKFPTDKDALVSTKPCNNIIGLLRQKKRWAVGGLDAPLYGKIVMLTAFLANFFIILTPLFFSHVCLYLAVFKISIDYFVLYPVHNQLGISKNLRYFPGFEVYYTLYAFIIPLILTFSRKVVWKGRKY